MQVQIEFALDRVKGCVGFARILDGCVHTNRGSGQGTKSWERRFTAGTSRIGDNTVNVFAKESLHPR